MNADLLSAASKVVPSTELLVNMVSRRVRQLSVGHRPLVQMKPGALLSDVALTEIIGGKLTWTPVKPAESLAVTVVAFPGAMPVDRKAA